MGLFECESSILFLSFGHLEVKVRRHVKTERERVISLEKTHVKAKREKESFHLKRHK